MDFDLIQNQVGGLTLPVMSSATLEKRPLPGLSFFICKMGLMYLHSGYAGRAQGSVWVLAPSKPSMWQHGSC